MSAWLLALLLAASDTLVVGTLSDPVSLDPHRATDLVAAAVLTNVCEPLVRFRADGSRPVPALATTWATRDRRAWTLTLRQDVRFHDGTALDADAVVANLESLRKERGFPGQAARVGPLVVMITLDRPDAALLATLSQPFFCMQSPPELRKATRLPVGTGPFRLLSVQPGLVQLEAYPGYWGGRPRLRRLEFRRHPNEQALLDGLTSGAVDVTTALGPEQMKQLHEQLEVTLDSRVGLNLAFLSINNERPPWSDRRVRMAVARAIDRPSLVEGVLGRHGEVARNPLPPSLWGYAPRTRELSLDRALSRQLLAEAGHPHGFSTSLLAVDSARPYMPAPLRLADLIREQLHQVGIEAAIELAPSWAAYLERATRGDYALAVLGWEADTRDPNDFLSALLGSESVGVANRSRYRSPEMDAFLNQGRRAADPKERLATYRGAQELFQRDMPWVPLYHVRVFTAYRTRVQGLTVDSTGLLRYDRVWKNA